MKKNIFSWAVFLLVLAFNYYLSWTSWIIEFLFAVIFYWSIYYAFHIGWSYLTKKKFLIFQDFVPYFIYRLWVFLAVSFVIFWSFVYYENHIDPAVLPEVTISNGKKTVVFQWMAHIWSNKFYSEIRNNIRYYKKLWFVLFYEWVKPWSKENMDKFDKLLWVKFDKTTYLNMSKLYNLRAQNNQEFLKVENDLDFNSDISIDEIISIYEKKYWKVKNTDNWFWPSQEVLDVTKMVNETINSLSANQLSLLVQVQRSVMNFIIKRDDVRNTIIDSSGQKNLFDVILQDRNKSVVDNINKSERQKIYVLYWLMHFDWVFEGLQKSDPEWKFVSVRYFTPIE